MSADVPAEDHAAVLDTAATLLPSHNTPTTAEGQLHHLRLAAVGIEGWQVQLGVVFVGAAAAGHEGLKHPGGRVGLALQSKQTSQQKQGQKQKQKQQWFVAIALPEHVCFWRFASR